LKDQEGASAVRQEFWVVVLTSIRINW